MELELKRNTKDKTLSYSTEPYRLGGVVSITNDTECGEGYFAITIFDTRVFVTELFEYVKDENGKFYVKDGKWVGDRYAKLKERVSRYAVSETIKSRMPCDGCQWKTEGRYQKCSCCCRNANLKDNYVKEVRFEW